MQSVPKIIASKHCTVKKFLNVFPVMEYKEGFELFCSESGYEIMDILHFFVQNYCNKNMKT